MALSLTKIDILYLILPILIGISFILIFSLVAFLTYKIKDKKKLIPLHYLPNLWPFQILFQKDIKDKAILKYVKIIRILLVIFLISFIFFIILVYFFS